MKSLPRNRNGIDVESDVYKMLQDYEKPVSEPKQSGSFRYLQGMLEAGENGKEVGTRSNVPASPLHLPATGAAGLGPSFGPCAPTKFPSHPPTQDGAGVQAPYEGEHPDGGFQIRVSDAQGSIWGLTKFCG